MLRVPSLRPSDLAPNLLIGDDVTIADDAVIGANVVIHDDVSVGPGARIDHGAVLGQRTRLSRTSHSEEGAGGETVIGEGAIVCPYALVGAGTGMGPHSFLGDHSCAREGVLLGSDAVVGAGCVIRENVEIGDRTRIQSHAVLGADSVIEASCFLGPGVQVIIGRTMGTPARKSPPVLRRGCQIGAGAIILPGVEIGEEAVVGAGAVVVSDVPARARVMGVPAREG
jgi:acetyltransferase-like isoleucine patch superfamily enzyme